MKFRKASLSLSIVLCLALIVTVAVSQNQPQPTQSTDQERMEAAHEDLLQIGEDKAAEASRLTQAVAAELPDGAAAAPIPRRNFVDDYVFERMERDSIPHAPLASDEEFLRRVHLDATGLLPTPEDIRQFLADTNPDKRDRVIDSLIGTDEFADEWAYHFGELLRTRSVGFHEWTKKWLTVDRPYNEVFYDIVTPVTKNAQGFPTAMTFYDPIGYITNRCGNMTDPDDYWGLNRLDWIDEITSDIGRVFLGVKLECISCHDGAGHTDSFNLFLSSKRRTDFWQQAAFFGNMRNVGRSNGNFRSFYFGSSMFDDLAPGYNTGDDTPYYTPSEGRFPRDGKTYEPGFLMTGETPAPGENARKALGRILPTHLQFARATVNIIWTKLMVVGLVEPYDGFDPLRVDPANPPPAPWELQPTNPELLNALAEDFRENNFSTHRVIKTIMKSSAYQLSTSFPAGQWTDAYAPYHARRLSRVLTGPEAVDIVSQATGVPLPLKQFGEDRQFVKELTNPLSARGGDGRNVFAFMQAFFQAERALPPVDKSMTSPVQAMMMMSSPVVTERVAAQGETRVAKLLESGRPDDEIIEELFLASLSRRPSIEEVDVAKRIMEADRTKGAENLQWSLLNSAEFLVNH